MSLAVQPMIVTSSSDSLKSGDGFSEQFPAGLRVLVVDDDLACLRLIEMMLKTCLYEVTKCNRAELALQYLRENKNGFDLVISDVHMPDMDGFKLLEHVGLEMNLPVIMMSADDSKNVVMKGVTHGACDYLIKPVRMEALKNIWQHVVRKKKLNFEQSGVVEDGDEEKPLEELDNSSSANERTLSRKRKDDDDEGDDSSALKKPRVVWSSELHHQFMAAVNQLGIDKAVPKKILELMNVPGLTRENVASHLQKYRIYLRRVSDASPHLMGINNAFIGQPDASFGNLDFQALAGSSPFSPQSLANIQSVGFGRVDQRAVGFENRCLNNSIDQINSFHGIPTNMNSTNLSAQPFGEMNMQILPQTSQEASLSMIQRQSRYKPQSMFMARNCKDFDSSNVGQSVFSLANHHRSPVYTSIQQPRNDLDLSRCRNSGFPAHNLVSQGMFHENGLEMKGPRTFTSNYMMQDWDLQNAGCSSQVFHQKIENQHLDSCLPEKLLPNTGIQNDIFSDNCAQEDDYIAAILKQEGTETSENNPSFNVYNLDNIHS